MFTGLVESTGRLLGRNALAAGERVEFEHSLGELEIGESVAVSGACLTVVAQGQKHFRADVSPETLARTTLGRLAPGAPVNFERAVRAGDRLGGHLVSGHVDGVAVVRRLEPQDAMVEVSLALPAELVRYAAEKGSLTVDGVSLTINGVEGKEVRLLLIPHTRAVTTLGQLQRGSLVNVEVDLIARYVERLLQPTDE